jgi:hypothetical protein
MTVCSRLAGSLLAGLPRERRADGLQLFTAQVLDYLDP